jgi:hypothetical protein
LLTQATDTRDQLWQALSNIGNPYDYVVVSNATFDEAVERVAANQYKFKDEYESIYFRSTEYSMNYVLDSGDVWGYIKTNNVKHLDFEMGAYINMGNERGYIEVNTDGCLLNNVSIRGLGTVASAIIRSFLLNANYVTFMNCDSQTRLSNTTFTVFEGSGTALHNETSNVNGCTVTDMTTSGLLYCFRYLQNITNITIYDIESTANQVVCFIQTKSVTNAVIKKIDGSVAVTGIGTCEDASNIRMEDFDSSAGIVKGISATNRANNIYIIDFDGVNVSTILDSDDLVNIAIQDTNATAGYNYGFELCNRISNCKVDQLDATGNCYAYNGTNQLSNCYAEDIDSSGGNAYGFYTCNYFSNCYATTCDSGFVLCNHGTTSFSGTNSTNGYSSCDFMTACKADSNGNDGFFNCDSIGFCNSINNIGDGYEDCNHIEHNRAAGNGGAAYNNCFADLGATRAAAATDAGGENA